VRYSYFPGCSLKGTGRAYEESLLPVFRALGVELAEIPDWNCCGATAYMSSDELAAFALGARNLALAERAKTGDVLAPCSACYLNLSKTQHYIEEYAETGRKVKAGLRAIGLSYVGSLKVRHPLDVVVNDVGLDAVRKLVKKPLKGLKVVPYYGCQIVRPYATFDDRHEPVTLDRLLVALGAEVVPFGLKARCCGGSLTGTLEPVGVPLAHRILIEARDQGADLITTVCPLCQFNLDGYQGAAVGGEGEVAVPVTYFTQLMGLAFGLPAEATVFNRGIVPPQPVLSQRSLLAV
jgi:heterodisulfide reductase subunit B2